MGHVRLGNLPQTRRWQEVVSLIEHGAAAGQVANASIRAAEAGLKDAGKDDGVVETTWLLVNLPHAAASEDPDAALGELGVAAGDCATPFALAAALSDAIDARLANNKGRTDLGEMAQMAAVESLTAALAEGTASLFDGATGDACDALARLKADGPFGVFCRRFYGGLIAKVLDYFLSRTLYDQIGEGRRFLTLDHVARFNEALQTHCMEAAVVVQRFSADWVSKTQYHQGGVDHAAARDFACGSLSKLVGQLKRGAGLDGD
jgi:hypothetical protein